LCKLISHTYFPYDVILVIQRVKKRQVYIPYNPTQDNEAMFYGYWAMRWVDSADLFRFNVCVKRDKTTRGGVIIE